MFNKIIFSFSRFISIFSPFSLDALIFSFIFSFMCSLLLSPLSSLFSSLLLSCLVSSLAFFLLPSCLVSSSLSLSLSVPVCPCLRVLLWWLLLCLVCMSLWSWCVRAVWCGTLKTPVCTFKTSPCVPAPRAHAFQHTCGRGAGTHGDVLNVHTGGRFERSHGEREEAGQRDTPTHTHQHPHAATTNTHNAQHTTQNTQGVITSSAYQNLLTRGQHLTPEVHQRNPWNPALFSV